MAIPDFSNILGQETLKKFYEDALSPAAQELGKSAGDIIKGLRLFTLPFAYAGAHFDKINKRLDKIRNLVQEENQIEAPPSIAGPIIERLKYLEDDNYLTDLYLNLLTRAIDKTRIQEAHPAFYHIIDQLSADEAMLLFIISNNPIYFFMKHFHFLLNAPVFYEDLSLDRKDDISRKITFVEHFNMYISHLSSLNLISWKQVSRNFIEENSDIFLRLKLDADKKKINAER